MCRSVGAANRWHWRCNWPLVGEGPTKRRPMLRYAFVLMVVILGLRGQAHAFCQPGDERTCFVNGNEGTQVCGEDARYGACILFNPPRECTAILPAVADAFDVECKAANESGCTGRIPQDLCPVLNSEVHNAGAITDDAYAWLTQ